jgi:hypothetical protein
MCEVIVQSLCPEITNKAIPMMTCVPVQEQTEHRDRSHNSVDFIDVPSLQPEGIMFDAAGLAPNVAAMVTRLLSRQEMLNNPIRQFKPSGKKQKVFNLLKPGTCPL